jgi:hypothetical protein
MSKINPKLKSNEMALVPAVDNARKFFIEQTKHSDLDEETLQDQFVLWLEHEYSCKMYKPYNGATRRLQFSDPVKQFWFKNNYED